MTKFSDAVDITDTIELVGGANTAGCESYLSFLHPGEIKYIALNNTGFNVINIEAVPSVNENYWRHSPMQCFFTVLDIADEQVKGFISQKFSHYPLEKFEERLTGCNFTTEEIEEIYCPEFRLSPNPMKGEYLYVNSATDASLIKSMRIFSLSGELIFEQKDVAFTRNIRIPSIHEKLIIVEVICGEERIIQKLFKSE